MNFHRSLQHPETPDDYISLLERYLAAVPYPATAAQNGKGNTIVHPDFHLDSIFIDPETNRITGIIDWQHAVASPVQLQAHIPQMLQRSSGVQSDECTQNESTLQD